MVVEQTSNTGDAAYLVGQSVYLILSIRREKRERIYSMMNGSLLRKRLSHQTEKSRKMR